MTAEEKFHHELNVFREEVESGIQFFYTQQAINIILRNDKVALKVINETPLFWKTNISALQTAYFIVLGRIFDQQSRHNIDGLIKLAQDNREIFSKEALANRKRELDSNADEWLDGYLKEVHEPTTEDFRRLKKHIKKYRRVYENSYRDIRRKIYAHKELSIGTEIQKLFSKTTFSELEMLFSFLIKLHESLWQLFYNGWKPILRPAPYSTKNILKQLKSRTYSNNILDLIFSEVRKFYELLANTTGN